MLENFNSSKVQPEGNLTKTPILHEFELGARCEQTNCGNCISLSAGALFFLAST
jgi:hypothetical protein